MPYQTAEAKPLIDGRGDPIRQGPLAPEQIRASGRHVCGRLSARQDPARQDVAACARGGAGQVGMVRLGDQRGQRGVGPGDLSVKSSQDPALPVPSRSNVRPALPWRASGWALSAADGAR